jgi:peptide-methionine (S)-S-oxide reductase
MQDLIRSFPGVITTRVGYTGGKVANATYRNHDGHAEAIEIIFDPQHLTYRRLLEFFFQIHDPTTANRQGNDVGTQYRSAIFFHGDKQRATALALMQKIDKSGAWKAKLTTEVAPAGVFYPAEAYHQHYLVKHPGGYDNHYLRNLSFGP